MEKDPTSEQLTQSRVDEINAAYAAKASKSEKPDSTKPIYSISGEYPDSPETQASQTPKQLVYLASLSKIPIAKEFHKRFAGKELLLSVADIQKLFDDLIKRGQLIQAILSNKEEYKKIFKQIFPWVDFSFFDDTSPEGQKIFVERISDLIVQFRSFNASPLQPEEFPDLSQQDGASSGSESKSERIYEQNVYFPATELLRITLADSGNYSTTIMKRLIVKDLREGETYESLFETETPSYTPLVGEISDGAHWVEEAPNTGSVEELAKQLHTLVAGEDGVTEYMQNNGQDFGFDFTNSALGKKLISQGYTIIEKTGFYPNIFWVRKLAENYPVHMSISNVVSINAPNGEVRTFYQVHLYEMPLSTETNVQNGIRFPNYSNQDHSEKTREAIKTNYQRFREEQSVKIADALGIDLPVINEG